MLHLLATSLSQGMGSANVLQPLKRTKENVSLQGFFSQAINFCLRIRAKLRSRLCLTLVQYLPSYIRAYGAKIIKWHLTSSETMNLKVP